MTRPNGRVVEEEQDLLLISRLSPDCILGSPYSEVRKRSEIRDRGFFDDLRNDFNKLCKGAPSNSILDAVSPLPSKPKVYNAQSNCILSPLNLNVSSEEKDLSGGKDKNFFENLKADFIKTFTKSFHQGRTIKVTSESRKNKQPNSSSSSKRRKKTSLASFRKTVQDPNKLNFIGELSTQVHPQSESMSQVCTPEESIQPEPSTPVIHKAETEGVFPVYCQVQPYQLYSEVEPFKQVYVKAEPSFELTNSPEPTFQVGDGDDLISSQAESFPQILSQAELPFQISRQAELSQVSDLNELPSEARNQVEPEVCDETEPVPQVDGDIDRARNSTTLTPTRLNPIVVLERLPPSLIKFHLAEQNQVVFGGRLSCPGKKKVRSNRRRRITEVRVAAGSVDGNVPGSTVLENPAFGIVCVDDNSQTVNASTEYTQLSHVDPLCVDSVNVKLDPDPLVVSINTSAVNHIRESGRLRYVEEAQQPCEEGTSLPPLVISPNLILDDTFCQSVNESDPLQLNDIKESFEGFKHDVQPSEELQFTEAMTCHALAAGEAVDQSTSPSQQIFLLHASLVAGESRSNSNSGQNFRVVASEGEKEAVTLSTMHTNRTCPICRKVIAAADFLEHEKSHELFTATHMRRPRRLGTTNSSHKFACSNCSFEASTTTDLSKHLKLHEMEESLANVMQQKTLTNSSQRISVSSPISSVPCATSAVPRRASDPLVVTLDDDDSGPSSRPSGPFFQSASSVDMLIQSSVLPANSSSSNVQLDSSLKMATNEYQRQSSSSQMSHHERDDILVLSDVPVQDGTGIPSLSTALNRLAASQSADSINPPPVSSSECFTNTTCTPNPPFSASSPLSVNGEESSLYSDPQSQKTHRRQSSDHSHVTRLENICQDFGSKQPTNTYQSPSHQSVGCPVNSSSQIRHRRVDSPGIAIVQSDLAKPTDNRPSKKTPQRSLQDLCVQTDILVTPDGAIKEIHTLRRRSSAEKSVGVESPQLLSRAHPMDWLGQWGPPNNRSQPVLRDSPEEALPLPDRCGSPSLSAQLVATVSREISVIQQSPRKSSVIRPPILPTQTLRDTLGTTSQSGHQSSGDSSNEAADLPAISPQLRASTATESARLSLVEETVSNESVRSIDSLRGPSASQSPASSRSEQLASFESVQAIDSPSNLSHQKSLSSESPTMSINHIRSLDLNQGLSVSSDEVQSSVLSRSPVPPISDSQSQLLISSRIDRLIEANARVLKSISTSRRNHSINTPSLIVAKTNTASFSSRNTRSFLRSTKSADSPSHSEDGNLNPAAIPVKGCSGSTEPTASTSCTISTPPVSSCGNVSSVNMPHAGGGPRNPNGNAMISIAGPIVQSDSTIRSTYDLRRKSLRTRTSSEKSDSSSPESDSSAMSDPDYVPPGRFNSDDESDNREEPNLIPRASSENTNPIPCTPLPTNCAANTGVKVGTTKIVSNVSVACPASSPSTSTDSVLADARALLNEKLDNLVAIPSSQRSHQERDEDSLILSNLLKSSEPVRSPSLSTTPNPLSLRQLANSSINQSLKISSSDCSRNATRTPSLPVTLPSKNVSNLNTSLISANTFSEAHSLMLANAEENTCAIPKTSDSANPKAGTSVETRQESTNATSSSSTDTNSHFSALESRANDTNALLDTNQSKNLTAEVSLPGSKTVISGISESTNSVAEDPCQNTNFISTASEMKELNSKETPAGCKETSETVCQATKSTTASYSGARFEGLDSTQGICLPNFAANAADKAQLKTTNPILESMCKGKSYVNAHENVLPENLPCAEVATSNPLPSDDPAPGKDQHAKGLTKSSDGVVDLASDDDSTDVDDPDPKTSRRKRTSSGGSSTESDDLMMVDPDYVPPSRDKLPLKTPDYVLDAIPSYEHWIRSKFIHDDSDTDTPRPENDCCVCHRKFPSHELLKEHRAERYADLKCCKCTFRASNAKTMKSHTNKHTKPKPYKCDDCGQAFAKRGVYVKHFLMHKGDFYYKCNVCDQGFNEYTPYEGHVNKHLNKTPYKCLKCNLAFTAKALLSSHKKRMHKRRAFTECTVCKKIINKFYLADHMKRHEERKVRRFLCEQCGRGLQSRLSLVRHMLQHTGERPHMCKYCGATFKVPGALKQHERKHTGERPFKCEVCGKTFAFNSPYTYHLRIHTGERPYKCQYCGMTFAQPSPYAVHKRLHTGERPYKCKICDDAFSSHAALRNHMQTHANSGNGQKRTRTTQGKAPKTKKTRKGRPAAVVDNSSGSSDDEAESAEVKVPDQPRRRSKRQTKCSKSLVEEESDTGEDQE